METRCSLSECILLEDTRVRTSIFFVIPFGVSREGLNRSHSNLLHMPDFTFPYHMTRSRLGLNFTNYEYNFSLLRNGIIEQTLKEATQKINSQLASNPDLANQAVDDDWVYVQEEHDYLLRFEPDIPEMTYGDIPSIIPLLSTWAVQYTGVDCDFDIWAWPGTSAQRKLGIGHILLAS